ncbi:MAG: hypothetical protein M1832_003193 [Thelocarpon impressellum]|nr:MAG: hypothetical protein M1832_003193 [Thelocarpon impressellum]
MGLGAFKLAWQRQTKDFGHDRAAEFTSLIFDNRGMGESDKPLMRYSTSEMAKDTLELLDHLGWTAPRQLHVTGVSMGGMIGQELALLIPDRIASLTLLSTAARLVNTTGYIEHLRARINLFIPKPLDTQLSLVKARLFSSSWLDLADADGDFPTNGDRFAAQELRKRHDTEGFTRKGFLLQAIAAGWHHKSAAQLRDLADAVGRPRIQVIHGAEDRMISAPHGAVLVAELGGPEQVRSIVVEDAGHVLPMEQRVPFRGWMLEHVRKTEELNKGESAGAGP